MTQLICHFQDYLSDLSPSLKSDILREANVEVVQRLGERRRERTHEQINIRSYGRLVSEVRSIFGNNASIALSAALTAGPESAVVRSLSGSSKEALFTIGRQGETIRNRIPQWALDSENWFLVESEDGAVTVQSQVSEKFPCLVFDNGPFDCATVADPEVDLINLEDILQATGIYQLWQRGNLGQSGTVRILDTGIRRMKGDSAFGAGTLSPFDRDGHGTAIFEMIRALSPKATIESICVTETFSGGRVWNLISGLTKLYSTRRSIVNLSIGLRPDWIASLGQEAVSFRESISNVLRSLNALGHFPICAAGNDGLASLRWPAACHYSLAVGSHNQGFERSSFSNYLIGAPNMILAPGGDLRQMDGKVQGFGRYGPGLTRDVYGTSFSTAVASALACLLEGYDWFANMEVASRISLFRNHCRQNADGLPILNVTDIGAVWPI